MEFLQRTEPRYFYVVAVYIAGIFYLANDTTAERQAVTIDIAPRNIALLENQTATFACHITQPSSLDVHGIAVFKETVTSSFGRTISYDDKVVYRDLGGDVTRHSKYDVIRESQHSFRLEIKGVSQEDAGKYSCGSRNVDEIVKNAELIVLEGNPECQSNATDGLDLGETITMWCIVTSRGRWAPTIHFSNNRDDVIVQNETIWENPHINARTMRYTATKVIDEEDHNTAFTALTYFKTPTVTDENEASNTPLYTHVHQFSPLAVKLPVTYGMRAHTDNVVMATHDTPFAVAKDGGNTVVPPATTATVLATIITATHLCARVHVY